MVILGNNRDYDVFGRFHYFCQRNNDTFTVLSTHFLALALAANCFHDKLNTVHILFRVQKCVVSSERREIK